MNEVSGYDAEFVDVIPDHLKCVICHMVLKDAMQLAACGHRYCKDCFNELKNYSNRRNQQLICPIDRRNIDVTKVFEDKAIQRIILDLKVFCDYRSNGCHWTGELRGLQCISCDFCNLLDICEAEKHLMKLESSGEFMCWCKRKGEA